MTAHQISRRTILRTGAVGAAGVGASVVIAACSSSSDDKAAATSADTSSAAATSAAQTSAADGSTAETTSGTASSAAAAPSGTKVAALSDIAVGGSISATLDGAPIVLTQTAAGTVAAFSAICPHQGCTVAPTKTDFDCPCHSSVFNASTGARISGPAQTGLTKLKASVADGSVYVEKS